jgi:hypothetical protein
MTFSSFLVAHRGDNGRRAPVAVQSDRVRRTAQSGELAAMDATDV